MESDSAYTSWLIDQVSLLERVNEKLRKQISSFQTKHSMAVAENKRLAKENESLRSSIDPMRESLNSLTSERGKWLRKLRRAGVNIKEIAE